MPERDLLDRRLIDHPLFYRWGADSQKLYYWLRRHACQGEAGAPAEALVWYRQGYLATYATADRLMTQAVPVSKNTLTKLIDELRQLGIVQTRAHGRGYVFLLGEWLTGLGPVAGRPLTYAAFYLDGLLAEPALPAAPS